MTDTTRLHAILQGSQGRDPIDPALFDMLRTGLDAIPGVLGFVLLANDGVATAAHRISEQDAQHIPAVCAGMASLSKGLADGLGGGSVLHNVVSLERLNVAITSCGPNNTLMVALNSKTAIGAVIGEIARKARSYAEQIGTPTRPDLAG
jgi:predicted regulator of Ras-like GTPase activity (Roadblock/LC7/MglB family)